MRIRRLLFFTAVFIIQLAPMGLKAFAQDPSLQKFSYKILHSEVSKLSLALHPDLIECMLEASLEIDLIYDRLHFEITPDYICLYRRGQSEMESLQIDLPVVSTSTPITGGINVYAETDPLSSPDQRMAIAFFDPLGSDSESEYPDAPVSIYFFEEYPEHPEGPRSSLSMFYAVDKTAPLQLK